MNKEEKIIKQMLGNSIFRSCLLSGHPWRYYAYSIPIDFFDKNIKGDIDILVRLLDHDGSVMVRAIEVKTFNINGTRVNPTRANTKERKHTQKQIKKLKSIGFEWVYLLDIFLFSDIDSIVEMQTAYKIIKERSGLATSLNTVYLSIFCDLNNNLIIPPKDTLQKFNPMINIGTGVFVGKSFLKNSLSQKIIEKLDTVISVDKKDVLTFDRNTKDFHYTDFVNNKGGRIRVYPFMEY